MNKETINLKEQQVQEVATKINESVATEYPISGSVPFKYVAHCATTRLLF